MHIRRSGQMPYFGPFIAIAVNDLQLSESEVRSALRNLETCGIVKTTGKSLGYDSKIIGLTELDYVSPTLRNTSGDEERVNKFLEMYLLSR